jgi:Ala-tRNA(Pro) deacylase
MTVAEAIRTLNEKGFSYELIPHAHTERAADEAEALGVEPEAVAKTVVLTGTEGYVRAVLPASERLDLHRLRRHLREGKALRLATEAELVYAYPAFELGAVPPFGGPAGDRVVVDTHVADRDWTIVEDGSHDRSVRVRTSDLIAATGAAVAEICHD